MNLIKQLNSIAVTPPLLNEDAAGGAVGAGSVAAAAMPLFASLVKRTVPSHPRIIKYSSGQVHNSLNKRRKKSLGLREAFYTISEDMGSSDQHVNFDQTEVLSKLKSLEDKESVDYRDTATFGLVDSNGAIVRVTVPNDQAQGFEQDIQHFLGDRDESEPSPEVAEVLFRMKDRYTIINVEWPEVAEDQEESQELPDAGVEGAATGGEGLPGAEGEALPGAEGELPADAGMGGGDTGQVQDLLTQVIDMMKADAEARKAEAQAREAEAKTKQANAAREQAMARVKQEEQFLDMDDYNKNQKAKDKEAKRLAQLAKWKHDMSSGEGELPAQEPQYDFLPGEKEEEELFRPQSTQRVQPKQATTGQGAGSTVRGRVQPSDVAKYIMSRVK